MTVYHKWQSLRTVSSTQPRWTSTGRFSVCAAILWKNCYVWSLAGIWKTTTCLLNNFSLIINKVHFHVLSVTMEIGGNATILRLFFWFEMVTPKSVNSDCRVSDWYSACMLDQGCGCISGIIIFMVMLILGTRNIFRQSSWIGSNTFLKFGFSVTQLLQNQIVRWGMLPFINKLILFEVVGF